ncbi:oxidoreductase, FAD/FMN-binding family protein [Tritrichomonas foetus]|uniref:Oxidoreductase, FAD/FMN-binding family protein n=1 Tax=Tritrichomonas foetus TaxID=1144522 RepID=A0A1J4KBP0_9EUKA|nr:oxidoreductase, FAD/FMN-binding family protein [Tritrichomonas foetus]|eukprot:OHT08386.1 oxidoreductase, FAD/FMN-binding family protein [Tritrichomonas foetus]
MSIREKSILFSQGTIGNLTVANRFIASAISYRDADQYGFPSDSEKNHIVRLARGRVGLIIPGYMFTSKTGRTRLYQDGMASSCHADAWVDVINEVHSLGSKIVFQVAHGGIVSSPETTKVTPRGPSAVIPGTQEMSIPEIEEIKRQYVKAANLLINAGADGIQIQCGHGFLLSQFLSPYLNKRKDKYGGSIINRARIVTEIVQTIRKNIDNTPLKQPFVITAKINGSDNIKGGLTPEMAGQTVGILKKAGVDLFEISSGLVSAWNTVRGKKSDNDQSDDPNKPLYQAIAQNADDTPFTEGYNVEHAEYIKKLNPEAILSAVGGNRNFDTMEKIVADGKTDFISLGRPLLKDPFLVDKFLGGKADASDCDSCNICFVHPPYVSVHCPKSKVIPLVE